MLDDAQSKLDSGEPALAIVQAHRACEVAISQRLPEAGTQNKPGGFSPQGSNLAKSVRAATGLNIQAEPFWESYCKSVEKRNGIVHGGEKATTTEARRALKAAKALLSFLERAANEILDVVPGNHDVTAEFAKLLRSLLESRGMSQKELAKRAKVSEQAISRLLCGKHSPTLRTIARIANVLGCKADVRMIDETQACRDSLC